jgi:hypothetical protein
VSFFRDAAETLPRYIVQTALLGAVLDVRGHRLTLVLVEGDSADDTWHALKASAPAGSILSQCHHGGRKFGSVVHAQRFQQLAQVGNHGLDRIPADADVVLIVESDLVWTTNVLMQLIHRLDTVPAVAPMVILQRSAHSAVTFYDTFAYRRNGQPFTHQPPYCEGWGGQGLIELDSAGSCLVLRGEVARQARYTEDEVIVGLCAGIRARGGSIWLDPTVAVYHE